MNRNSNQPGFHVSSSTAILIVLAVVGLALLLGYMGYRERGTIDTKSDTAYRAQTPDPPGAQAVPGVSPGMTGPVGTVGGGADYRPEVPVRTPAGVQRPNPEIDPGPPVAGPTPVAPEPPDPLSGSGEAGAAGVPGGVGPVGSRGPGVGR